MNREEILAQIGYYWKNKDSIKYKNTARRYNALMEAIDSPERLSEEFPRTWPPELPNGSKTGNSGQESDLIKKKYTNGADEKA